MNDAQSLVAPCGIDCVNCEVQARNITPELKTRLGTALKLDPEKVPCQGCRQEKGCRLQYQNCPTLDCVTAKGHAFCYECGQFPCGMLQPTADRADKLPHNLKVFNLCRIKAIGVEKWLEQEAKLIRQKYYQGKMMVGRGPVLE
jgi:hypothetical protein